MVFTGLVNNLALLLALGVLYSLLLRHSRVSSIQGSVIMGFVFGAMLLIVMKSPITLHHNLVFDTRSVILSLAGLFGGGIVAGISVVMGALYRTYLGGIGAVAGVVGIIWVGLAGYIYHRIINGNTGSLSVGKIYSFGLVVQLGHVSTILLLPADIAWPAFQKMFLPMMVVLPLGIVILGIFLSDIQSRLDAENKLKESERRIRDIIDNSPAKIFIKGKDFRYQMVNREFLSYHGFRPDEPIGKTDYDLWERDTADQFREEDIDLLETGKVVEKMLTLRTAQGEERHNHTIKFPLRNENNEIYAICVISSDITERLKEQEEKRMLEARLNQAEKMEAIGTLAGGIAHDFNNILTAIVGYGELALIEARQKEDNQESLSKILEAGTRAKNLVKQILSFSRKHEPQRKVVDMSELVNETKNLIRASLPSTIEISSSIEPQLPSIYADPNQLHQVIMNLMSNAAYAMGQSGGSLTLRLSDIKIEGGGEGRENDIPPGHYLKSEISDTGSGISPEIANKVFEPFFTTKKEGDGTGMGLAVVHGIIKKHGGFIFLDSELGSGTTFTIYLPVADVEQIIELEDSRQEQPLARNRHGNILLVDDEEAIVDLSKKFLERLGYRVFGCTDSQDALERLRNDNSNFDLLVTDMTMPRMTGLELAKEANLLAPDLPIILCSGQAQLIPAETRKSTGIRLFLTKPVPTGVLAHAIEDILENGSE